MIRSSHQLCVFGLILCYDVPPKVVHYTECHSWILKISYSLFLSSCPLYVAIMMPQVATSALWSVKRSNRRRKSLTRSSLCSSIVCCLEFPQWVMLLVRSHVQIYFVGRHCHGTAPQSHVGHQKVSVQLLHKLVVADSPAESRAPKKPTESLRSAVRCRHIGVALRVRLYILGNEAQLPVSRAVHVARHHEGAVSCGYHGTHSAMIRKDRDKTKQQKKTNQIRITGQDKTRHDNFTQHSTKQCNTRPTTDMSVFSLKVAGKTQKACRKTDNDNHHSFSQLLEYKALTSP